MGCSAFSKGLWTSNCRDQLIHGVGLLGDLGHLYRDLIAVYIMGGYRKDRARPFSEVHRDRARGNKHKLDHREVWLLLLLLLLLLLITKTDKHWRGPREVVGSPSFKIFRIQLDKTLSSEQADLIVSALGRWTWWPPGVPSNLNYFTVLCFLFQAP